MEIREQSKIVELWLTRKERDDPAFRESLKPIYQQYKDQKYLVAVFLSGEEDLYQQTRDLLLYNRRRLAEKEVQAEILAIDNCLKTRHQSMAENGGDFDDEYPVMLDEHEKMKALTTEDTFLIEEENDEKSSDE